MKKAIVFVVLLLVFCAISVTAYAADANISENNNFYDLAAHGHGNGDRITIAAGCSVKLIGNAGTTYTAFEIVCLPGVHLTLQDVNINDSANEFSFPVYFQGTGNALTLTGTSTLKAGEYVPAVCVESSTDLTIGGAGTLNVTGGDWGAGIGGSDASDGGSINITGGTVIAQGGSTGPGIGGGAFGSEGSISISGGTVVAIGGYRAAGLGGGYTSKGGSITISGGMVTATGGEYGAGIGGGQANGSGEGGSDGAITITGGTVLAARGSNAPYDIGCGEGAERDGTLGISGTAAVFLRGSSYSCISPVIPVHTFESITGATGGKLYGISVPWTGTFGAYLRLYTLSYDANGGASNSFDTVTQHIGTTVTVADGSGCTRTGYLFGGWNTEADGSGTDYQPGSMFTFTDSTVLYANWNQKITANGTYDLNNFYSGLGDVLTIKPGLTVTLTGPSDALEDFQITCDAGVNLTLQNVKINDSSNAGISPLSFTGTGNRLGFSGTSTLQGGQNKPAVCVEASTALTIDGTGTLNALGGADGAAIGSGANANCGILTISGGTVNAMGYIPAPIFGGCAGIGGGKNGSGGSITITGGIVTSTGGDYGAGIGGGAFGSGGSISITGGTLTATGGIYGAGIGGGTSGSGGSINITGGTVFAARGANAPRDIGYGSSGSGGTLGISGTAAVFLRNDSCTAPTTTTHMHRAITGATGGNVFGIPVSWSGNFGAYLRLCTVSYDTNGGSGTTPASVEKLYGETATVASDDGLSREGYSFAGWNTKADCTGTTYQPDNTITLSANVVLYAWWLPSAIDSDGTYTLFDSYSGKTLTINPGHNVTLTGTGDTLVNFQIVCGAGAGITLKNVKIDDSTYLPACPISFTGANNILTLTGTNTLTGGDMPAVQAQSATGLEIIGSGKLTATGGFRCAGIGGSPSGEGGTISITGGTVDATGGYQGAGIGSGYQRNCGTISITGGTITAKGGFCAAGIGGGKSGSGGNISITGATVTATGGNYGSGIGGGDVGGGGSINITGGMIQAAGGIDADDIGCGSDYSGSSGALSISGTAAVFLRSDTCILPSTSTHTHNNITGNTGSKVYGVPVLWTGNFGAYLRLFLVTFNANGGSGAPVPFYQHIGTTLSIQKNPTRANYAFRGWYKEDTCVHAWNFFNDTVNAKLDLFAKWVPNDCIISTAVNNASYGSVTGGGTFGYDATVTLTATPNERYRFVRWMKGTAQISTAAAYQFTVSGSFTYTAEFAAIGTPTTVSAVPNGYNSVKVSWSAVAGASGYEVWRCTSSAGTYRKCVTAAGTTYTDTGLTTGAGYYYKVKAYCTVSTATTYGSLSVYALAKPVPAIPTLVSAVSISYNSVKVTWSAAGGATGYEIWREASGESKYIAIGTATQTTFTNSGLVTGRNYNFMVRAYKMSGSTKVTGSWSAVVSAIPIPAAPMSAKAVSASYNSITVTWSAVTGATMYEVWQEVSGASTYSLVSTAASTSFTKTGLITGTKYYYKLRAYRLSGSVKIFGIWSAVVFATPIPSAPVAKAESVSYNSIKVSWGAVAGATNYQVYRATSQTGTYTLLTATTAISYINNDVITGTTYYYKVKVYRLVGSMKIYGDPSAVVLAKASLATPSSVQAVPASSTSVTVSWDAVAGTTMYEVYSATASDGVFVRMTTTSSLNWTNTGLVSGKTYWYRVRAYRLVGSTKVYSLYSATVNAIP